MVTASNINNLNHPIGSVFEFTPVSGAPDLSTAESVKNYFGFGTWNLIRKVYLDSGWLDFSWTNSSYIGTTQPSYTKNKWRVKDNVLYIFVGIGATSTINTGTEYEVARIPITGNDSISQDGSRVWNGAVGAAGSYGGFCVRQNADYISINIKPHTTSNGQSGSWFSSYFTIPLDDGFASSVDLGKCKYVYLRSA